MLKRFLKKLYESKDTKGKHKSSLEKLVAKKLTKTKKTIGIAESCTGGLLSKRLTDIPGSSKYIKLNVVTYSDNSKNKLLSVPQDILKKYGAVSAEVVGAMAVGIKKLANVDIGLSVTGIAGPTGGTKTKPIGLIYFGLANRNNVKTRKMLFGSNATRDEIRWLATQYALNWLKQEL